MYRTHTCGELRIENAGQTVTLAGWVQRSRRLGGMTFIDLRDRYGITQLVVDDSAAAELKDAADSLGREYVIQVTGTVIERQSKNPKMPTGDIEISLTGINILNKAQTPPFTIEDVSDGGEELRAKYRYLDLRPICYECPFKSCRSGSDITIADYWGINELHPEMDDDKGTSMVYLNSDKGKTYFPLNKVRFLETDYREAFRFNNVVTSSKRHTNRDLFYKNLDRHDSVIKLLDHYAYTDKEKAKRFVRNILTERQYEFLKSVWHRLKR